MSTYPWVPLGEVCTINPRIRRSEIPEEDTLVSFVPMAAVDERFGMITAREDRRLGDVSKGFTAFKDGDVLIAKITPCMENGKAALARHLTNGVGRGSTEFYVLRPDDKVLGEYVYHFVRQPRFREKAKRHFTGTAGQQRVPKSFMENVPVPLPPIDKQRRIVGILNRAARIEHLRARAAGCLREFIPALFIKMFGDPVENPIGWDVGFLGDLCASIQYGTSKKAVSRAEGVPILRMGNVSYDGYLDCTNLKYVDLSEDELEKYSLLEGDLLFNRTNSKELVGKTGIWDGRFKAVAASYFIRLRIKRDVICPIYIWAFMNSSAIKRQLLAMARGAVGQANINAKEVKVVLLPIPPLKYQHRFADIVRRVAGIAGNAESASGAASTLTASLTDHLLDGNPTS